MVRFSRVFFTFFYPRLELKIKQGDSDINMATCNSCPNCGVLDFHGLGFNKLYPTCNFAVIFGTSNIPSVTIISSLSLIVIATVFNQVVPLVLYTTIGSNADSLRLARCAQHSIYINLIQAHSSPQLERRRWSQALFSLRYHYWVGHDASTVVARVSVLADDACNRKMSAW